MTEVPIIDQLISAVAPVLHRDTINPTIPATQDAFVNSAEAFFDKISDTTVNELNQVTTKIDATVSAINIVAQELSEAATIAIASGQYKGDWVVGFKTTGYSLGDNVTFTDGYNYVSKINNNLTTPITLTNTHQWNFIEAVNPNNYYLKTETYTNTEVDTLHKINNKTAKTTPVDEDLIAIADSTSSFSLKKLTWADIKATIISSFGVMISTLTAKTTPVDEDLIAIADSTSSFSLKKLSWADIKATIISSFGVMISTLTAKTTLVDADIFTIGDSAATNASKKLTWGNIKATLDATWTANNSRAKTALNASGTAPIYACRAWVNFNGTGTVAIRASGNVSSITDNGTGDYTINFTTAMPDANYVMTQSGQGSVNDRTGNLSIKAGTSLSTTSVNVIHLQNGSTSNAVSDPAYASLAFFR